MRATAMAIRLLILDVDGVLTSGQLPYLDAGGEVKSFHVQDGTSIKLWRKMSGLTAIISGRNTEAVARRAKDLGVDAVLQGVKNKVPAYVDLAERFSVGDEQIAVVGDDWMDVPLLERCGYGVAVANALPVVKRAAKYVTHRRGGEGVVAEVVERLLRVNGAWMDVIRQRGEEMGRSVG